jgi:serine/threonine-protein kinase
MLMRDLVFEQLTVALVGRYVPDRALGHGAMASVYLATDVKHGRHVAIKALRQSHEDPAARERFLREIGYLAQLQHPLIVPLFDSGDALGMLYYVTAYLEGQTLRVHLDKASDKRLPVGDAARIAGEIADALDYAHARNVLHRDVKPDNVLLHDGHALLADFGIARAIQLAGETALTNTGVAIGTPIYMSPEQLTADRGLDARSDVYGLACVVYEMLAGFPPFIGNRGVVNNALKFTAAPAPVCAIRGDVKAHIDEVLARALAADPDLRYATAGHFVAALDRARQLESG